MSVTVESGRSAPDRHSDEQEYLVHYFAELLAGAGEAVIAAVCEDLEVFDRTGYASLTVLSLIKRAQCLADADRIELKFAA